MRPGPRSEHTDLPRTGMFRGLRGGQERTPCRRPAVRPARTTMGYGRGRKNLDRHPNYILAVYLASGT